MLVYFLKGELPWEKTEEEEPDTLDNLIKEKKVSIPINLLCEGLPAEF